MRYFNDFSASPMYYQHSFWPEGFISLLINVLVWGIVIYLVMMLVKKMSHGHGCCGMHGQNAPEEKNDSYYLNIAKERYAKGEIDKKQFDQLKKDFSPHHMVENEVGEEKTKE